MIEKDNRMQPQNDVGLSGNPVNHYEMIEFLVNPQMQEQYPEITRDLVLSNLDWKGQKYVYDCFSLAQDLERLLPKTLRLGRDIDGQVVFDKKANAIWVKTKGTAEIEAVIEKIRKDAVVFLQSSRSRNGFERLAQGTQRMQTIYKDTTPQQRSRWGFKTKKEVE